MDVGILYSVSQLKFDVFSCYELLKNYGKKHNIKVTL